MTFTRFVHVCLEVAFILKIIIKYFFFPQMANADKKAQNVDIYRQAPCGRTCKAH